MTDCFPNRIKEKNIVIVQLQILYHTSVNSIKKLLKHFFYCSSIECEMNVYVSLVGNDRMTQVCSRLTDFVTSQ